MDARLNALNSFPGRRSCRGFTLFELLLSVTILSIVAALILGTFRVGYRAWEKGDASIEDLQRLRTVLDRVRRQLAAAVPDAVPDAVAVEDASGIRFYGAKDSIRFISAYSLVPGIQKGRVIVNYRITETPESGKRLVFHEKPIVFVEPEKHTDPDADAYYELLTGVDNIAFEYLESGDARTVATWSPSWDPETDDAIPSAIRIWVRTEPNAAPVGVIARLTAADME